MLARKINRCKRSLDHSVIVWSRDTFSTPQRINFLAWVQSLVFADNDTLFAGAYNCGIMAFDSVTGSEGQLVIPSKGSITCLALGAVFICKHDRSLSKLFLTHLAPQRKLWTASTHELWSSRAQCSIHMAIAVLWKSGLLEAHVLLPFELVELILKRIV